MLIAIYSRKSKWTGKGESVENQLVMCREYVDKFITSGEKADIIEYEDEGFSGKNTKRPQFQKMMNDINEKHFDYLVCYKLDRMGRNIGDLAFLIEELERKKIAFVSIKEKFDTSTPIGKAMLYFSGVLAQMEREQIAERVRDNMVMLARSGRWLGGNTPLGFEAYKITKENSSGRTKVAYFLKENEKEINLVKFIFEYFLEKQSLTKVVEYLLKNNIRTRCGKEFVISGIRDIITNPVYCQADNESFQYFAELGCQVCIEPEELNNDMGLMSYAKTSSSRYKNENTKYENWIISVGKHKGIISGSEFIEVQKILKKNKSKGDNFRTKRNNISLLSGLLYCSCGHDMRPKNYPSTRVTSKGDRTFAYLCRYKDQTHGEKCNIPNVHGNTMDEVVCEQILALANVEHGIVPLLKELKQTILDEKETTNSEIQILQNEYDKKQDEIRKLLSTITKIGVDSVSAQYINKEIERLDSDCKAILMKIDTIDRNVDVSCDISQQVEEFSSRFESFEKLFPTLDINDKRNFLKGIIQKVVWDGEMAHIYLRSPVHDKHRTLFCRLWDKYKQRAFQKFPLYNHRIAAAAGTDDCKKFSFRNCKGDIT